MLLTQHFVLLLMLICDLTHNTHQNGLPFLTNNHNERMKRFLHGKSSKSKFNSHSRLTNNGMYFPNDKGKQSQNEPNKGYTQQELAEIKRILSKNEDDYYGILNINKYATRDKIITTHRRLTLNVHPDKLNVPGATEATQRINKARVELLKQFENQNQNNNQQITTTKQSRTRPSTRTTTKKKVDEVTNIIDTSNLISTFSPSPSEQRKESSKTFNYLLIALIVLIIGVISFIIYWKKRQRHSYSTTDKSISKKPSISPTYDSPESSDGDTEASIVQDEE